MSPPDADWAIVILAEPLGTPDRILPVLKTIPPSGTHLALGGYEQDRLHIMIADLNCVLTGIARDAAKHTMLAQAVPRRGDRVVAPCSPRWQTAAGPSSG
jgi:hypothetical protein